MYLKKKLFIICKNGYIAKRLLSSNVDFGKDIICTSRKIDNDSKIVLDLFYPERFNYNLIAKGDVIFLLASISSPDICKTHFNLAYKINVEGTRKFIKEIIKRNAKVLFFSSDIVYGNTEKPVDENSFPNPLGEYAKMKNVIENDFLEE